MIPVTDAQGRLRTGAVSNDRRPHVVQRSAQELPLNHHQTI